MSTLAIRRDCGIGDILEMTPSLRAIWDRWGGCEVAVFTHHWGQQVLLHNPCVSSVVPTKGYKLASGGYDQVVDLGAIERHPDAATRSRVDIIAELLEVDLRGDTRTEYYPRSGEISMARRLMKHLPHPWVVLAPMARDPRRSWVGDEMHRFVGRCLAEGYSIIPIHHTDTMAGMTCWDHPHCRPVWGEDLRVIGGLLPQADAVVSVDTGVYHLAIAAAGSACPPLVLPFGATDPAVQMSPYGYVTSRAVQSDHVCGHWPCAVGAIGACRGDLAACRDGLHGDAVFEALRGSL